MQCSDCLKDPKSHSFEFLGHSHEWSVYYTAPAKATTKAPEDQQMKAFKLHLDAVKGPWIWIFDCSGMGMKHCRSLSFTKMMGDLIATHHDSTLGAICILQPNLVMREMIRACKGLFKSDLLRKVVLVDGSKLEVMGGLEKQGLTLESRVRILKTCGLLI